MSRSPEPIPNRRSVRRAAWAAALALLLGTVTPVSAKSDPVLTCKAKIIDGAGKLLRQVANATQKCRDAVLSGDLPGATDCATEPKTAAAIAAYESALARTIARNCGGDDNTCTTGDDLPLAAIGWAIGTCPTIPGATCGRTVASCADVATCLACLARGGVGQITRLAYDQLSPTDPDAKALRKCQATIGRAAVKLVSAQSSSLGACWRGVDKGKATAPCPDPGDGKAGTKIDAAVAKLEKAICKACGGADKQCGGGDDFSRSAIGFPNTCPSFGGCARPVTSLTDVVACVGCVTGAGVDCPDRAAVPSLATYPAPCPAPTPNPQPTLNYSLPPNYGSTSLVSGFVPDPYQVGVTSGGSVNVSYLGGGCTGFATSAPDFSVNYTNGAFPTLRFYFLGNGDSTMVVNAPNGVYRCSDDSFGTLDPTIDYASPASGRYDVWIGSFSSGQFITGTLSVTESTGNHP